MVKIFPSLCHHLNCWVEATEITRQCQDLLQDRHQQLALVKEAQAMGRNHPLYSVIKRYNSFKRARDAHEKAKTGLKEKIDDCEKQINMHNVSSIYLFTYFIYYFEEINCCLVILAGSFSRTRSAIRTMVGRIRNIYESRGPCSF